MLVAAEREKKLFVSCYVQYTINIASIYQDANQFGRTDKYFSLKPNRGWGQTFSFIKVNYIFLVKWGWGQTFSMFFFYAEKDMKPNMRWFFSVPNLYSDRWVLPVKGEQYCIGWGMKCRKTTTTKNHKKIMMPKETNNFHSQTHVLICEYRLCWAKIKKLPLSGTPPHQSRVSSKSEGGHFLHSKAVL